MSKTVLIPLLWQIKVFNRGILSGGNEGKGKRLATINKINRCQCK